MCLSDEARDEYWRLARAMDDDRLEWLDRYYREDVGRGGTTVDFELHFIVSSELEARREKRICRLNRALWLSSRRGRLVEVIRHWLVRHGLWDSARPRLIGPPRERGMAVFCVLRPLSWMLSVLARRRSRRVAVL